MQMLIGTFYLEVLKSGMAYYKHSPNRKYLAYKVEDDDYGISYAVKERDESGRYGNGWYHRHLNEVIFIPNYRLIGV